MRKQLFEGGKAAIDASQRSDDPAGRALVDPDARAVRKRYEDEVEAVAARRTASCVAKARFERLRHQHLPRRHVHAAPLLRRGEGLHGGRQAVAPFTTSAAPSSATPARSPSRCPKSLARREEEADAQHAVQLRHHQRHHRRQLGLAGDQQGRRDRRPDLRRQHPVARRRLRLRRERQPRRGRALRGASSRRSRRSTGRPRRSRSCAPAPRPP